jgi:uncharacterized protein (TIGR02145 family)
MKKLLIVTLLCSFFACSEQEAVCTLAESKRWRTDNGLGYMDFILVENVPKNREALKRLVIYHFLHMASGIDTLQTYPKLFRVGACCTFIKSTSKTRKFFIEREKHSYGEKFEYGIVTAKTYIGLISIDRCKDDPTKMTVTLGLLLDGIDELNDMSKDEESQVLLNECEPDWYEANKNNDLVKYYTEEAKKKNFYGGIDTGRFIDERDGKSYKTTVIGGKKWMAENLNYQTDSSWCYDGDDSMCDRYGRLYDWRTATTVCPVGYHLPSGQEWDSLVATAGGDRTAGKKLRVKAVLDRCAYPGITGGGTDNYGFSAEYGGSRYNGVNAFRAGYYGNWWTAGEYGGGYAYYREMTVDNDRVRGYGCVKECAMSVRCIHD